MRQTFRGRIRSLWPVRLFALTLSSLLALSLMPREAVARTYVITDGDRVVAHTTFATDPAQVLQEAGVTLGDHDTYTARGWGAITVRRTPEMTLRYRGQEMVIPCGSETVGQLLRRLELEPEDSHRLSHDPQTPVYPGMELQVDQVITREEHYTQTLAHTTRELADSTLPLGTRQVLTAGRDGELSCTAQVTYYNGQEIGRQVLRQDLTIPAVEELVAVGTREVPEAPAEEGPVIGDGYIILPTGEILTYTGTATIRASAYTHTDAGCDFITATGTTVHVGTVAVDPRYIPYGTRMFIVSNDGAYVYGIAVAEDCGGAIKGDRMDLYFPTYAECIQFGRRVCTIYYLG